jgi:hypothetical protein
MDTHRMIESTMRGASAADGRPRAFPIIDEDRFADHPKSHKPHDLRRILRSPNSEDWVTWTAFALLERCAPATWWPHLVAVAKCENPVLALPAGWDEVPELRLWQSVRSPPDYERMSRERMARSDDELWRLRSRDPRPVEGSSEIDVTLGNGALLVCIEAKLGSDVSPGTKYDPDRNQILRNVDCAIDLADGRTPMVWLFVRDDGPQRSYGRLLRRYRAQPDALAAALPHRDAEVVRRVAGSVALLLWRDVIAPVSAELPSDGGDIAAIKAELVRRCTVAP